MTPWWYILFVILAGASLWTPRLGFFVILLLTFFVSGVLYFG